MTARDDGDELMMIEQEEHIECGVNDRQQALSKEKK